MSVITASWHRTLVFTLVMLGVSACATPMNTGSQCIVEPGTLDEESTFTWRSMPAVQLEDQTGFVSPLALRALEQAVKDELSGKGFTFVNRREDSIAESDQWSDLEVAITLKTRREVICMTADGFPCGRGDCRDCVDFNFPADMEMRTVGFLAADVYYLGTPIWRGWVERDLFTGDRNNAEAVIGEAVPVLFESFPP